jgi:hypothetical protein
VLGVEVERPRRRQSGDRLESKTALGGKIDAIGRREGHDRE